MTQMEWYDTRTRYAIAYYLVTCKGQVIGALWASAEKGGRAASYYPRLDAEIHRDNLDRLDSTALWSKRLDQSFKQGLTPLEAIRSQVGVAEHPQFGGIAADVEELRSLRVYDLWDLLNLPVPLDKDRYDAPMVQDGEYFNATRADPSHRRIVPEVFGYLTGTNDRVVFLPVTRRGVVAGYVWASEDGKSASYIPRSAVGRDGTVASGLWISWLIDAYAERMSSVDAL